VNTREMTKKAAKNTSRKEGNKGSSRKEGSEGEGKYEKFLGFWINVIRN